jgi:hypothetical protein
LANADPFDWNNQRTKGNTMKQGAIAILTLTFPLQTLAAIADQPPPASSAEASTPENTQEEIIITGEKILLDRIWAAEKKAYDVFNTFNDEKRFEINCSKHSPTGTLFNNQLCLPAFQLDALQGQAQDYRESLLNFIAPPGGGGMPDASVVPTHVPSEVKIASQMPAYKRKLKEVAEQHPEFLEALIEYNELKQRYQQAEQP